MGEIRDFRLNGSGNPPRQSAPRRLAAIVAGDISGYSRLVQMDEEGTHGRVKRIERELIGPSILEHHGRPAIDLLRFSTAPSQPRDAAFSSGKAWLNARIVAQASLDRVSDWCQSWRRYHRNKRRLWRRRQHCLMSCGYCRA